eukprot:Opistho-1_new@105824
MDQRGHQRGGQELLVIGGDIEQRHQLGLDGLHLHAQRLVGRAALGRSLHFNTGRQRAHHLAHIALQQARCGGQLCVVQQRDGAARTMLHVTRQVWRNMHHAIDVHALQRIGGLATVEHDLAHFQPRCGCQHAHQLARQRGRIFVPDGDRQPVRLAGRKNPAHQAQGQHGQPADHGPVPGAGPQPPPFAAQAGGKGTHAPPSTMTLMPGRTPSIGLAGRARTSKVRASKPWLPRVVRQVAKSGSTPRKYTSNSASRLSSAGSRPVKRLFIAKRCSWSSRTLSTTHWSFRSTTVTTETPWGDSSPCLASTFATSPPTGLRSWVSASAALTSATTPSTWRTWAAAAVLSSARAPLAAMSYPCTLR